MREGKRCSQRCHPEAAASQASSSSSSRRSGGEAVVGQPQGAAVPRLSLAPSSESDRRELTF